MPRKKPKAGDPKFKASTQDFKELEKNVSESQALVLPEQEETFRHESSRQKRRAHNLPDFKILPLGYSPTKKYYGLYPELYLPALHPPGDQGTISFGSSELPPNELYLGDNLQVLRSLHSKSIDLIYIDPPFFSGRTYNLIWGDDNELRTFGDIWEDGLPSYLEWLNARLWEMARVLKDTGSIYVHCDWHASHYIKTEMDKIFGYENFQNEIIWAYEGSTKKRRAWDKKHEILLMYSKGKKFKFSPHAVGDVKKESSVKAYKGMMLEDENGKFILRYRAGGGFAPKEMLGKDRIYKSYIKDYIHPKDWWVVDFARKSELIGYPTQKPEALLERIIKASSNPGDVVADFFMGGGTT